MKMPAEIRTALRKILRDHSDVTKFVKSKSEVNDLTRDELIALGDNLGIDFIQELNDQGYNTLFWEFEMQRASDPNFQPPFAGEIMFELSLSALGAAQTRTVRVEYEFTPAWQYACLKHKRLKYRRNGSSMAAYVEIVFDEYLNDGQAVRKREWVKAEEDLLWRMIDGPIDYKIEDEIEQRAWKEDQKNRKKLGFKPGIKAKE